MSWFGISGSGKKESIPVEVCVSLDTLYHVPPGPGGNKPQYYFIKAKSHDSNSRFTYTCPITPISSSSRTVMVCWDTSFHFKCRLVRNTQTGQFRPTTIRLSIRSCTDSDGKSFERFGYVHLELSRFVDTLEYPQQICRKDLLEQCKFNSILKYSVELTPTSNVSLSSSGDHLDSPRHVKQHRQSRSRHRRASSISESSSGTDSQKDTAEELGADEDDEEYEGSKDSRVSSTFLDILSHYDRNPSSTLSERTKPKRKPLSSALDTSEPDSSQNSKSREKSLHSRVSAHQQPLTDVIASILPK